MRQLVRNRIPWILAALTTIVSVLSAGFAYLCLRYAQEQNENALVVLETVYDIHASHVTTLVEGLTHLQDGDPEIGYRYLELLLTTRVHYLEKLEEPHPEVVASALADADEYFERFGPKP